MKRRIRYLSLMLALVLALAASMPSLAEGRVTWDPSQTKTLTMFADVTWLPFDALDGIVPQWIAEETGISIDLTKSTDDNQITLMVASGDLPDLVMTPNTTMFRELSDAELCLPFDDLIAQYVPNWQVPEVEQKLNAYYSQDGKFYMVKNYFNTIEDILKATTPAPNFGQFHVRGDLYAELGSPAVKNEAQFMELLALSKEKYPDMVPMVFQHRQYSAFASLVGLDRTMPSDADGNYVHEMSDPKFRDFLRVINDCFRAGYILEENFSHNTDEQQIQFVSSGSAFMITNFALNDEQVFTAQVQKVKPDASFIQMDLMDDWKLTQSVTGWAGTFISKDCSDPEAAIKLIAWLKEGDNRIASQMGVQGTDWWIDDQGMLQMGDRYKEALEAGALDRTYTPVAYLLSASDYLSECMATYTAATERTRGIFHDAWGRISWSNVQGLCYPPGDTDEGIIRTKLTDLMTEYFPIVCMSKDEAEFDANFTKMMAEAEAIGIAQLNAYYTNTYKALSEEFGSK